jgi:hypothetical protein
MLKFVANQRSSRPESVYISIKEHLVFSTSCDFCLLKGEALQLHGEEDYSK